MDRNCWRLCAIARQQIGLRWVSSAADDYSPGSFHSWRTYSERPMHVMISLQCINHWWMIFGVKPSWRPMSKWLWCAPPIRSNQLRRAPFGPNLIPTRSSMRPSILSVRYRGLRDVSTNISRLTAPHGFIDDISVVMSVCVKGKLKFDGVIGRVISGPIAFASNDKMTHWGKMIFGQPASVPNRSHLRSYLNGVLRFRSITEWRNLYS